MLSATPNSNGSWDVSDRHVCYGERERECPRDLMVLGVDNKNIMLHLSEMAIPYVPLE